ncbi:MAG: MATE family efflux transporter [Clostridia bacterium]|nr:MATE family efflux transporter [Clostridia bacterium]
MVRDMTKGSPLKLIFSFFFPLLLGNLFQQVYSMVDSMIVGRFVGVDAFAGISATGSLNFLILGFLMGMCSGCTIPVSQAFGAGDMHDMRKYFANAIYLAGSVALLMTIVTVALTRNILQWIGTPADIIDEAYAYIVVIFGGMCATMLYNLASGVLRAVGDTKTPLFFLIFSCFVNVGLDLLCVLVFHMGVSGAAWATIISQLLSGVLCTALIFGKYDILRIRKDEWKPEAAYIRRLFGMGLPMGLQFSITAIGSIILQSAVNTLGSGAVASIGAGSKVQFVFTCPLDTIGVTLATYCGQNLGARRIDRVRTGVRQSLIVMLIYCVVAYVAQRAFGIYVAQLFIDGSETEILANASRYLDNICLFFPLLLCIMVFRNALQGLGFSRIAMFAGIFELVGRSFVAFALVGPYGFSGAIQANPAAWIMANLLLIPAYIYAIRRLQRQFPQPEAAQ